MRRINSEFQTVNMSEEGQKLSNRDYFGYVEMDDFACYVLADSLDGDSSINSAKLVVESIIRDFTEVPSMGKGRLKRMAHRAHTELLRQKAGMHLKASAVVAVTDYQKIRYVYVGNSRYYLIRNDRILEKTTDQSLTSNLVEAEKITLDQAAAHEERNNLYSFLGERGTPKIQISKKRKLENGDVFLLLTRGVWEQCPDEKLLEIIRDANEPEEVLYRTEDWILERQETAEIDNYTMAVTFVRKVYQSPKKPWTLKKILMVVIPVVLVVGGISIALFLGHRSIQNKEKELAECMEDGETYFQNDNYQRAVEEVLRPDIYGLMERFLDQKFEQGQLQTYEMIKLTGQSCKSRLFTEALKEYVPGKLIQSTKQEQDGTELKMCCLKGALSYFLNCKLGYMNVIRDYQVGSLPYEICALTHENQEKILIHSLDAEEHIGYISRFRIGNQLDLYLNDDQGKRLKTYYYEYNTATFERTTQEEINRTYRGTVIQEETDTIVEGEMKFFVWVSRKRWGFVVLPVLRDGDLLYKGEETFFDFEDDTWELNFFDGKK